MPVITYTAVNRGELASGHSAGNSYEIETNFWRYPRKMIGKGTLDETLSGLPEGWLDALQYEWDIQSDLVAAANVEFWREFFSSVINGEAFTIDFTGTAASPVAATTYTVWLVDRTIDEQQEVGYGVQYSFTVKNFPS